MSDRPFHFAALGLAASVLMMLPASACDLHGAGGFNAFHGGLPGMGGDGWGYQPFIEDELFAETDAASQGVAITPVAKPLPTFATPATSAFEKASRARAERASRKPPSPVSTGPVRTSPVSTGPVSTGR